MFNLVKGTHDIILSEADKYTFVEETFKKVAESFNYKEFRTPIIEVSELFQRSVGDSSDIVRKEMYTFLDKGDRSITLRPEMTAGIIRSIVNNKLLALGDFPIKAYYVGPCFRYERPQQGRYRQFNQFGVECVGINSPYRDAEIISLLYYSLKILGFENITVSINSLGDEESRNNYKNVLRSYFEKHLNQMCSDCKERFNLNVLRILDCKVEDDKKIIQDAPLISDYLNEKSKNNFEAIKNVLNELSIPFVVDDTLVRGLDYYSDVVFEIKYTSKTGKDYGALCAGGHYNKLVEEIGGPKGVEGSGFAVGIERIVSVMEDDSLFNNLVTTNDVYVIPLEEKYQKYALEIANTIRLNGFTCEVQLENRSLKSSLKKAIKINSRFAMFIGEEEVINNTVTLKDLYDESQSTFGLYNLIDYLDSHIEDDDHEHLIKEANYDK